MHFCFSTCSYITGNETESKRPKLCGWCVCMSVRVEGVGQIKPEGISLQMIHPFLHSLSLSASVVLLCWNYASPCVCVSRCVQVCLCALMCVMFLMRTFKSCTGSPDEFHKITSASRHLQSKAHVTAQTLT